MYTIRYLKFLEIFRKKKEKRFRPVSRLLRRVIYYFCACVYNYQDECGIL